MSGKKIYNRKELKERRRELRGGATQAEKHLWHYLKHSKLANCKFRRQNSIGNYIVDFFCYEKKLVIELDGQPHFEEDGLAYDKRRTEFLESLGLKVIRFENREILYDTDRVLNDIKKVINKLK